MPNSARLTKIVATIGPATESEETLSKMVEAGMNVARFNTKHADPAWHKTQIQKVRQISDAANSPVGILLDLQGPEIRVDLPDESSFLVKKGDQITFTSDRTYQEGKVAYVPQELIRCMSEGSLILLDDGICEFVVTQVAETKLVLESICGCEVKHRKTVNTPGTILGMPSLTKRDLTYLDEIESDLIDFVGLSFVRDRIDVDNLKQELEQRGIDAGIIAKIENQAALDNISEIIKAADGVMIARGDLGVEIEYQQLTYWQKQIINQCRQAAKPVITATQMLESMINNPRPTRAEVSDVANAIYDGTDAVMLSAETTIGKYPVAAVRTQAEIALFNERHAQHEIDWPQNTTSALNITSNAANMLLHSEQKIDKIVCLTESGNTSRLLSRFRPKLPIYTVTHKLETYRRTTLSFGTKPYLIDFPDGELHISDQLVDKFKQAGIIKSRETAMVIHGSVWKKPGLTNTLALINT